MNLQKRFIIQGLVQHKNTGEPLCDFIVKAYDADYFSEDDYLGSAITDTKGFFEIVYREEDFVKNILELFVEGGPDLVLTIC
jgi:hypothetical protein